MAVIATPAEDRTNASSLVAEKPPVHYNHESALFAKAFKVNWKHARQKLMEEKSNWLVVKEGHSQ